HRSGAFFQPIVRRGGKSCRAAGGADAPHLSVVVVEDSVQPRSDIVDEALQLRRRGSVGFGVYLPPVVPCGDNPSIPLRSGSVVPDSTSKELIAQGTIGIDEPRGIAVRCACKPGIEPAIVRPITLRHVPNHRYFGVTGAEVDAGADVVTGLVAGEGHSG